MYDFDQVKELLQLVASSGVGELEIERNGYRLRIAGQQTTVVAAPAVAPVTAPAAAPAAPAPAEPASAPTAPSAGSEPEAPAIDSSLHVLNSPIVGTFYSAPDPDSEVFVKPGDPVKKGQVVCIVEAMKLMNEIECDVDGTVVEVLQENAQAVEFGQPLFTIRPA